MATPTPLVLGLYTKDVSIFRNTRAIDIPGKIDSVVNSMKVYANTEITTPVEIHVMEVMRNAVDHINTSITSMNGEQTKFISDMQENISGYLDDAGAGYSVSQARSLKETGNTGEVVTDDEGRITSAQQGVMTTSSVMYDDDNRVVSFSETITIGGIETKSDYIVTYDERNIPSTTKQED